jgi:hypothetical protein
MNPYDQQAGVGEVGETATDQGPQLSPHPVAQDSGTDRPGNDESDAGSLPGPVGTEVTIIG